MTFDLTNPRCLCALGVVELFRVVDSAATYRPDEPYATSSGRFDDGIRLTLYLGGSATTAVAEWYRHSPELMQFQTPAQLRAFRITCAVHRDCVDLRTEEQATAIGISFERTQSSERDIATRYQECRKLAHAVDGALDMVGILYRSPAAGSPHWCIVLFGSQGLGWELATAVEEVPVPVIDPASVTPVEG